MHIYLHHRNYELIVENRQTGIMTRIQICKWEMEILTEGIPIQLIIHIIRTLQKRIFSTIDIRRNGS